MKILDLALLWILSVSSFTSSHASLADVAKLRLKNQRDDALTGRKKSQRSPITHISSDVGFEKNLHSQYEPCRPLWDRGGGKYNAFFPIGKEEITQFLAMSTLMFLFIYMFTTVRDTKDTLVVSNCGAEAIPFLKLYGVMPTAIIFIVMYSKMSEVLGKQGLFYATLIPFFVFYLIFAFVLFPNRNAIHFMNFGVGKDIGPVMELIRHWSFGLYFIISELWASAGIPLLFWQVCTCSTALIGINPLRNSFNSFDSVRKRCNRVASSKKILSPFCGHW